MTIHLPGQSGPSPHLPWPWAWLIALALVTQLALIWNHAPWADELQAVLLARDTNTLSAWYTNFRYEGHPPLWHLLLKLLLTVFDELTALRAATSIAALTTAALIVKLADSKAAGRVYVFGGLLVGGTAGTIQLKLTREDTAALQFTAAVYDLMLYVGDEAATRLVEGPVKLSPAVTRKGA